MANIEKVLPEREIELGGKVRVLKCGMYEIARCEKLGEFLVTKKEFFQNIGVDTMLTMAALFLRKDDDLNKLYTSKGIEAVKEEISEMLKPGQIPELMQKVMATFASAMSEAGQAEGNAPTESPQNGIG